MYRRLCRRGGGRRQQWPEVKQDAMVIMGDRAHFYRGYDIAYYWRDRDKVSVLIRGKGDLPPIHMGPQESSLPEAERAAKALIDETLAARAPASN
jgi:hypothetical protein